MLVEVEGLPGLGLDRVGVGEHGVAMGVPFASEAGHIVAVAGSGKRSSVALLEAKRQGRNRVVAPTASDPGDH